MAGHVDVDIVIPAPLDVVWRRSNEHERWAADRHGQLRASEDGLRLRFHVSHVDPTGRAWEFDVERCLGPQAHTVYARRSGNPDHRYSVAWWLYSEEVGGTRVRCVQDFEMMPHAPIGDREMESVVEAGTRAALARMAARVMEQELV